MSKVEKHPTDKGKYQSTFDNYGHGEGNGKSKTAIYKHFKTLENQDYTSAANKNVVTNLYMVVNYINNTYSKVKFD